jgi:hypothetical protein
MARLLTLLLAALLGAPAWATPPLQPLDDGELSGVVGGDGLNFAAHIVINDPSLVGAVTDSRLSIGFNGNGQSSYIVLKNVRGTIDMFSVSLSTVQMPDGSDAVAIGLPGYVKYSNFGFESLSVQSDPLAPVTNSMGSLNINGTLSIQGQVRMWAH